ncbi:mucin-19-like [Anopheles cruzii]|uniref:mucin-19-like n=1 Tax=Anopheles cruzii TaxID=68878 RepID=UPI0022EC8642|nr:mucin-19-like [Anopheles cruzii]
MNANKSGGNSTTASVYRLIQSPAPICMFYFAHPFGIASPASGAKLAQIRDRATKGKASSPLAVASEHGTKPAKTGQCRRHKSQTGKEPSVKVHRKLNGYSCSRKTEARLQEPEAVLSKVSVRKSKKHRKHRRISNFEKFLLEIQDTCGGTLSKIRRIDQENRITRLVPWPSIIWNRDFLMPPLLQALALQHGREIPDIEQILRTVRSAWNTPKSQRSNLRSQDSRESSSSNWDLSSTCDSYCCYQNHRMGAGTYANAASPGPGLLRRRYSVPEIIMRKHTLAQQKSGDEPLLLHDTNHNVIDVVNKNVLLGAGRVGRFAGGSLTSSYRKSGPGGMRRAALSRTEPGTRSSSVESGIAGTTSHEWTGTAAALLAGASGGSDPNLTVSLKHPQPQRSQGVLCNGLGSSRAALATGGTGGSLRCINNNSLLTGSSSSVNGLVACGTPTGGAAVAGVGSAALVGIGCGHHHVLASGSGGIGFAFRDVGGGGGGGGDYSMRKTTLLRRMWSRELRRYERSGSWSPPLRRAPRRIYSVESMVPATPPEPGGRVRRPSSSGSSCTTGSSNASSAAARDCGTATTGTTTASCLECAQLERQYLGGYAADRTQVSQCASDGDANGDGEEDGTTDPTVDDRRRRRARRMCSSQAADLGESQQQQAVVSGTVSGPALGSSGGSSVVIELDDEAPDDLSAASSSVSSEASFREVRPAAGEAELSEFLQQERLQERLQEASGRDGDGGSDSAVGGQTGRLGAGRSGAGDHSGERAPVDGGSAGAGPTGTEAAVGVGQRSEDDEEEDDASSVGALSALSDSSDSSDTGASEAEPSTGREEPRGDGANGGELDQYIASLLLENLESAPEEPTPDGGPDPDRQNNNEGTAPATSSDEPGLGRATTPLAAGMKQKLTGKYIGGGGGVVCNSPPSDKRKAACSPAAVDKENAEDVANNNNNAASKREEREPAGNRNRQRKQKEAATAAASLEALEAVIRHPGGQKRRSKGNGFYLTQQRGAGRDASQIDLNGKYYFPAYGLETDPSDNTDVASEPEPQVLGKVGTGSTYGGELAALARSVVVPRFSAMPRTESMEVQPSTSAEDEDRAGAGSDSDDDDDSLVDSLDGFQSMGGPATTPRKRKDAAATTATTDSQTSPPTDRSPRHEKGEAFFVPIQDSGRAKQIDERVVADTMPLRMKERLNNRRRMMKWKQEQESLKKQRKMMRMIEQKRFYGAPAIQVISTIDKAISRKEYLSPAGRKTVFGARSGEAGDAGGPTPFRAMKPKKRTSDGAAGLRSGLGMLESYKIDGKGNMQIQTPASGGGGGGGGSAPSGRRPAAAAPAAKSPWGTSAERRPTGGKSTSTAPTTATSTLPSSKGRPGGGRTPAADVRRKQVLKDVQQMQLYPQADLTPDIEGGPRRVYQKTEIQEGDKHIEILEIVECADSAPRSRPAGRPVVRVRSAGRHGGTSSAAAAANRNNSRIPVPVYRFGHFRRSNQSRDGSPLAGGINPKVDRMIADLLLEALSNPDEMGIKFVKTPENLRAESAGRSSKGGAGSKKKATTASSSSSVAASSAANTLTPRRTASGRYKQKFEMIPEERSSVSVGSSTEELSASSSLGRAKKAQASPRRVSFDENYQILNVDELGASAPPASCPPAKLSVPSPSKQPKQPALPSPSPAASPRKGVPAGVPKSPHKATQSRKPVATANAHGSNSTTTTTSRGKAAIQSDVIEERGWIGFSTQHEDMATPVNGQEDEDTESFVTDSLNTKPSPPMHCCTAHQLLFGGSGTPMAGTVVESRPAIGPCHRSSGHTLLNATATDSVKEIREENAWHVYQTADCKVIQSKIEYYETTSIHRTPVTAGSQHHHHHQSYTGAAGDLFGPLVEHAPSPDSFRHGLSTADSLEAAQHQQHQQLMASLRTAHGRTARSSTSVEPPKTSETTCSSCCFCNPELHRATGTGSVRIAPETCFYCHAKSQSPHKSFPAPPTPPNIQTSPVPPSPQTPIAELTPTPSLPEITLPEKRKPPPVASESRTDSLKGSTVTSTTASKSMESNGGSVMAEATKKTEHTKLAKAKASDTISTRGNGRPSEKPKRSHPPVGASGSSTAQTIASSTAPSMADTGQKSTPKLGRKKSEAVCNGGVLNRPKHTNQLVRASTVVHSVQKEVKNELKAPLKALLPKTAKELNNRREKERQIGLSLPLGTEQKVPKSRTTNGQKGALVPPAPSVTVPVIPAMVHSVTAVMVDDRCGSDSQSYDEASSSASSTPDTSPNSSPFKKATGLNGPPAAARWKTNSERNLSQLSIQKMVSASKWGNKWRKGTTDRQDDEEEHGHGRDRAAALKGAVAGGSCSDLSPLKTFTGSETVGFALGDASAAAGGRSGGGGVVPSADTMTTAGPSIINGITQTATNQGWTVTVAGNYNPEMAPDVEMRLSFPKGSSTTATTGASNALTGGGSGGKSLMSSSAATTTHLQHDTSSTGYPQAPGRQRQYMENGHGGARGRENYGVLEHGDGLGYLGGGSRNASRAAALPPPVGLNPKRSLTRSDGTGPGGGGNTAKDYRLPNVGPAHNVLARPTAKKAIKTVECSVVASATRTIANNYHELSHHHQEGHHLQQHPPQHHFSSRGPAAAGLRSNRSRPVNVPQASAQILHPTLQNGSGGKFLSSSSPSLVSQQQHPSQRMHHPEPPYHLEDYGNNVYYGHQQPQHHQQARRLSLESQHHPAQLGSPAMDCLSIMGNAIAPELKPKVPTMSEKDLTRRHHPCYTRTQPYFS